MKTLPIASGGSSRAAIGLALAAPPSSPAERVVVDRLVRSSGGRPSGPGTPVLAAPVTTEVRPSPGRGLPPEVRPSPGRGLPPGAGLRDAFDSIAVPPAPATARLLEDNLEAWNARWSAIAGATSSIDAGYFALERDVFGHAFLGHLLAKARRGIRVRVLTDAAADPFGASGFKATLRGQDYLQELVGAGAEVRVYHPLGYRLARLGRPAFAGSYHDKVLVVDGRRGITGGRNIGHEYYAGAGDLPTAWRDTCVLLEGAAAAERLTRALEAELSQGEINRAIGADRLGNWRPRDVELLGAYALMDTWLAMPLLDDEQKRGLRADAAAREREAEALVTAALPRLSGEGLRRAPTRGEREHLHELALELTRHPELRGSGRAFSLGAGALPVEAKIVDSTSVAGARRDELTAALLVLTRGAQRRIVIENPYLVVTETMIEALAAAARRGVDVYVGTNSPLSTDSDVTQAFFLEDWPAVMARIPGLRLFVATGQRKHHQKVAVFDDHVSVVSTYNLDLLSSAVNSELAAVLWSEQLAREGYATMLADKDDPRNGVVEYRILRDERGRPVLAGGRPIVTFGPEHHLPEQVLERYRAYRAAARLARHHPWAAPLRHGELERVMPPGSFVRWEELTTGGPGGTRPEDARELGAGAHGG